MRKMNEYEYEIYDLIRNAFHSQSGFFLNKQESYDIMLKVKQVFEAREMKDIIDFCDRDRDDNGIEAN